MNSVIAACLFVLIAACYVSAEPGFVQVYNSGGYIARFLVEYELDGKPQVEDSGDFSLGVTKSIKIPDGAQNVYVKTLNYVFFGSTSTIFTETFPGVTKKCYKIWGTTLNPSWQTIDC